MPNKMLSARVQDHFSELTDPRRREVIYPLINIVTIAICGVICGADDFVSIAEFGRKKKAWLSRFLDLSAGIPSQDRFNAILGALKPGEFEKCLLSWIADLHEISDGQVVAIDGKTLRRSFDAASSKSAIHMVSAWATANHISLGQVVVDEKSNEITAIPKLLEMLEISGCLVTIDAMGCQTEIAKSIVDAQADYVLAVKANQPTLHAGIVDFFADHIEVQISDTSSEPGAKLTHHDSGGIFPGIAPTKNASKSVGEWNRMKVAGKGNKVTVILNGEVVNDVPLDSRTIKDRPASGYIGFQDHGLPLSLRNIYVQEL